MAICIPFLGVKNVEETATWYISIGFACTGSNRFWDPEAELAWAQLEWEGAAFMLFSSEKEKGNEVRDAGLFFRVNKMDGLVDKLKEKARIIELTEAPVYGKTEVVFEDLNGFRITFTAEPNKL